MNIVYLLIGSALFLVGLSVIGLVVSYKAMNEYIDGVVENEDK